MINTRNVCPIHQRPLMSAGGYQTAEVVMREQRERLLFIRPLG